MPSEKIIQLNEALAARGFSVHTWTEEEPEEVLAEVSALKGGVVPGELAELWAQGGVGTGLAMREVMRAMVLRGHFLALVDGSDGFDLHSCEEAVLKRMLWVRAGSVEKAIKSADLLLRDGNLPLVILQLQGLPLKSLRSVPTQHWYRLQRLAKETGTACLIITPQPMVPCARKRWEVSGPFSLDDLERDSTEVVSKLHSHLQRRQGMREVEPVVSVAG